MGIPELHLVCQVLLITQSSGGSRYQIMETHFFSASLLAKVGSMFLGTL